MAAGLMDWVFLFKLISQTRDPEYQTSLLYNNSKVYNVNVITCHDLHVRKSPQLWRILRLHKYYVILTFKKVISLI